MSAVEASGVTALADALLAGLAAGDVTSCQALFSDDATIWHNADQQDQAPAAALAPLAGLAALQASFDVVSRDLVGDVCVQQLLVRATSPSGNAVQLPMLQRITVDDGRIRRIEEYLDTAQVGSFFA